MNQEKKGLSNNQLALLESEMAKFRRSNVVAYLLFFFLGVISGHQFYLGNINRALLFIALLIGSFLVPISATLMGVQSIASAGMFLCCGGCIGLCFYDLLTLNEQTRKANDEIEARLISEIKTEPKNNSEAA